MGVGEGWGGRVGGGVWLRVGCRVEYLGVECGLGSVCGIRWKGCGWGVGCGWVGMVGV